MNPIELLILIAQILNGHEGPEPAILRGPEISPNG